MEGTANGLTPSYSLRSVVASAPKTRLESIIFLIISQYPMINLFKLEYYILCGMMPGSVNEIGVGT